MPATDLERRRSLLPVGRASSVLLLFFLTSALYSLSLSPRSKYSNKTALDLLVSKRITGLPVVDGEGVVVSWILSFFILFGERKRKR